jgi:hypothetical protein
VITIVNNTGISRKAKTGDDDVSVVVVFYGDLIYLEGIITVGWSHEPAVQ